MKINNNMSLYNSNSSYNNNVAFRAKLNLYDEAGLLDKYADRLPEIIKGFETKTAQNNKMGECLEFGVDPCSGDEFLKAVAKDVNGNETSEEAILVKGGLKKLFRKDDNAVVNHLVKFFNVAKKNADIWLSAKRFQRTMESKVRYSGFEDESEHIDNYAFAAQDAVRESISEVKFFRNNVDHWDWY